MKLAILGHGAGALGRVAAGQPGMSVSVAADPDPATAADLAGMVGAPRWTVDPVAALSAGESLGVIVSGEIDGGVGLVHGALDGRHRVLLAGVPTRDPAAWDELARDAPDGLTLSRPPRFDPHFARTREVLRAGTVGTPRTLDLGWSVNHEVDVIEVATELVDVACWLLDSGPVALYAVACGVAGPLLAKINVLAENGALAVIEVAAETEGFPATRHSPLGERGRNRPPHRAGRLTMERRPGRAVADSVTDRGVVGAAIAAWRNGDSPPDRLALGPALRWNLAAARALAQSLADGEMAPVSRKVDRS